MCACVYVAFKTRAPGSEGKVGSDSTVLVLALRLGKQLRGKVRWIERPGKCQGNCARTVPGTPRGLTAPRPPKNPTQGSNPICGVFVPLHGPPHRMACWDL